MKKNILFFCLVISTMNSTFLFCLYKPQKKYPFPTRANASDAPWRTLNCDVRKGKEVQFDDGSLWTVRSNDNFTRGELRDSKYFHMITAIYERPTKLFGVTLWTNIVRERMREGTNNKKKYCEGQYATFTQRPKEFSSAGYALIAGPTATALIAAIVKFSS